MRIPRSVSVWLAAAVVVALVAIAVRVTATTSLSACDNSVRNDVVSPDGRWHAVVFQRSCGASTAASTQVSVLPADRALPNSAGNVFVGDDRYSLERAPRAVAPLVVEWPSATRLVIRHPWGNHIFLAVQRLGPIEIAYVDRSPPT